MGTQVQCTIPSISFLKKCLDASMGVGHQWLTPVILATREAEIRRIAVQSQPRQIDQEILSQKYPTLERAEEVATDRVPA
jgi:hypothetical protein